MQRCTQVTLLSSSAQLLPPKFASRGGNMELFKPGLCFSYRIFLGRAVNMTKRSGKFENVYSEIAWRGQTEQRREGADGCRCSRSWQRFSTRTSVLVSFWGRFQQSLLVGYEGSSLMMLLTSSLQRCSTAAYVTARAVL